MKLEIIVVRDPDGDTDLLFFLDGQPVDAQGGPLEIVDFHIDPGSSGAGDEWAEEQAAEAEEELSDAARDRALELIEDWRYWS